MRGSHIIGELHFVVCMYFRDIVVIRLATRACAHAHTLTRTHTLTHSHVTPYKLHSNALEAGTISRGGNATLSHPTSRLQSINKNLPSFDSEYLNVFLQMKGTIRIF